MAKTSPRNDTCAFSTKSEFVKSPDWTSSPAVSSAPRDAGITPPFAAMATQFRKPPSATTQTNRNSRFLTTHAPASAYVIT